MEARRLRDYSIRVSQANRSELVVISYEIIIDSIHSANDNLKNENFYEYEKDLKRSQKMLNELMGSLDYQYMISRQLMSLYIYANGLIVESQYQKQTEHFPVIISIMEGLKAGFEGVSTQDSSQAVMQNTQKVYAGLTYGRYALNESFVGSDDSRRGFRA